MAKKYSPKQLKAIIRRLSGERGTWESHWQEIADHVLPRKNTILDKKSPGQKRTWQLLDNTGVQSNELLAGALHGFLTNPDMPFFEFTTGDMAIDNQDEVRQWLQVIGRTAHKILNNSNFQTEVHEMYLDLPSFGIGCMYMEEDPEFMIRFSTKFIADYYIDENRKGFIDRVYRCYQCTAADLIEEFGEQKVTKKVRESFAKGDEVKFKVIHAVYPRYLVDPKDKSKMKFISQYILEDEDHEIEEGQYQEFPYAVPRWSKAAGEKYGRSPAMTALPELKVLNKMNETMLIGAQKVVDPPVQLPDDGFVLPIITRPGGINYYRAGSNDMIKPIFNDTRIDFGWQAMQDRRARVKDAFYIEQLKLQQGGPMMTATEVLQRKEEAMILLGPMLGRMDSEFLRQVVEKLFRIMVDRNLVPPAPSNIQGQTLSVKYSSLIAKAQRINEGQSVLRAISAAAPFIQLDPEVALNFNGDESVRIIVNTYGAPQEMMRTREEVKALKQAKLNLAAQQQQQVAQSQQLDDSLKFVQAAKEAKGF